MYGPQSFVGEIGAIRNQEIRNLVETCLQNAPSYFWTMPASSTGKYHPAYSLGEGGLVRHTKAAVSIALDLLSLEQNQKFATLRDHIIAALILHDTVKKGRDGGAYTTTDHPLQAAALVREMSERVTVPDQDVNIICELIETHMGQWNTDFDGNVVMRKPETDIEQFVHMCDYLASRKTIEVKVL